MEYFPVFFDMWSSRAMVIGAGEDALRKVRLLQRTPAEISLVCDQAPDWPEEFTTKLDIVPRADLGPALSLVSFVIIAEEDPGVRDDMIREVRAAGKPVNVVDNKGLSEFILPSIMDRGKLITAISSSGASPILASRIRAGLERRLPEGIADVFELARAARVAVQIRYPDGKDRRAFWGRLADLLDRDETALTSDKAALLFDTAFKDSPRTEGSTISVVSLEPSDHADDVTLGDYRKLQTCDVVLHDIGIGGDLLDLVRRDAARHEVTSDTVTERLDAELVRSYAGQAIVVMTCDPAVKALISDRG